HTLHTHPHSVVSGAYYVQTPPQSVPLRIEDPRMAFYMNAPVREHSTLATENLYYEVPAKSGDFVMFESWVRHEVPPNRSKKARISLSFNYSLESED
ncbi:MAG: 2OG-Fe(II) oxygenase family protein, partial [Deltaproteobacteria bacterium]